MLLNKHKLSLLVLMAVPIFFIMGSFFTNLSIFFLFLLLFFFKNEFKKQINYKYFIYIFGIFIFFILNGLFSEFKIYSLQKSLLYLRFVILLFGIYFFTSNLNLKFKNILFKFYLLLILFVIFDTIFQFIFGIDIFGFKSDDAYLRLSGPFGDELIVGFFSLYFGGICLFCISKLNLKYQTLYVYMFIVLIGITVFLSGERSAFLSFLIFLFFLFLFSKNQRLLIFSSGLTAFLVCCLIFVNSSRISDKYSLKTIQLNQVIKNVSNDKKENKDQILILKENKNISLQNNILVNEIKVLLETIKNSHWMAHFNGGIMVFKSNYLLGSGFKTYRFACYEFEEKENVICTLHPHNIYIELLSDMGLGGIIIFLFLIGIIFFNFIKKKCISDFGSVIMFSIFLTFIFPLKPHGSLFSTNYAFIFFLIVSYLIYSMSTYVKK